VDFTQEHIVFTTNGLQRSEAAVPPVFIFGTFVGSLVLTDKRIMFLSSGDSGAGAVLASHMLGILAPAAITRVTASLGLRGSFTALHTQVRACAAHRRWDFGRYLRITYEVESDAEVGTKEHQTSFIMRGPGLGSSWIDDWVERVVPFLTSGTTRAYR
jgi:hypothetical protein